MNDEIPNIYLEMKEFAEKNDINKEIKQKALDYAQHLVRNMLDETYPPLRKFPSIDLNDEDSMNEFILVIDFLKQSNFTIPIQVLEFESQNPGFKFDRKEIANKLGLNSIDPTPLIMQMIQKITKKQKLTE